MKLLFIQGGSRVKIDSQNNYYVDGNFNKKVLSDYCSLADETFFILRKDGKKYADELLQQKFNEINGFNLLLVEDIYSPSYRIFDFKKRKEIKNVIKEAVKTSDRIIIRSIGNFYTNQAFKYCKKFKKKYLIEVTGFAFDGLWYHSLKGKMVAIPRELFLKRALRNAPYALYVTQDALQNRYPCRGNTLGCSDVRIQKVVSKEKNNNRILNLVTVAFLDVKWKGQADVLKALKRLKEKNIRFKYHLIGSGNGVYLKELVNKYHLQDDVVFVGALSHEDVFKYLPNMDIYIQPSYQEGLCRAIVEAMSVGLPVVCSNAGGNYELVESKYIFKKGNVGQICRILSGLNNNRNELDKMSKYNNIISSQYLSEQLINKRNKFYLKFMNEGVKND